jgi:diguanylate cyclase (GGDEF)-like protein
MNMEQTQLLAVIDILNEVVAAGLDRDAVCELVVSRAMTLTNATGAVVELVEGDEMVYHRTCGSASSSTGVRLHRHSSLSGRCVKLQIPLKSDDTENDPRVDAAACKRVQVASMVCVPLFHRGEAVGVLKVLSTDKFAFQEAHVGILGLLANVIGSAMGNAQMFSQTHQESVLDPLTGISNRRAYDTELAIEFARCKRYGHSLTLGLLDLDGFKTVNDTLGHPAGDDVLRDVAQVLSRSLRSIDRSFRLGGDEFAILLPETSLSHAIGVVERVSDKIAQLGKGVSVSAGLQEATAFRSVEEFHSAADQELYRVKSQRKLSRSLDAAPGHPMSGYHVTDGLDSHGHS